MDVGWIVGWMDGFARRVAFARRSFARSCQADIVRPEAIHGVRMVHDREGGKHTLLLYNSYYDLEACNAIPKCFGAPERA